MIIATRNLTFFSAASLALASMLVSGCAMLTDDEPVASAAPKPVAADPALPPPLDPKTQKPGLAVGDKAPNVDLVNLEGKTVALADLYRDGPTVVTFYRGGWCPFCNKALAQWQMKLPELREAGATFIAITPETPENTHNTVEKIHADYMVLSDTKGEAMRRFKVAFTLDDGTQKQYKSFGIDLGVWNQMHRWELPAPATFVIDKKGVVRWVYADWNYRVRAEPDDVISAVKALR